MKQSFIEIVKCSKKDCENTGSVGISLIDAKGKERTKKQALNKLVWYCEEHEGEYK